MRTVRLGLAGLLLVILALVAPATARAAPEVFVVPSEGPAGTRFTVAGGGFASLTPVALQIRRPGSVGLIAEQEAMTNATGSVVLAYDSSGLGPGVYEATIVEEATQGAIARATFTITSGSARFFPETGRTVGGRFLAYWEANGGLALNGFPISDEFDERLEDGGTYRVQYFERVRLELRPNNPPPYDVLLGQFGRRIYQVRIGPAGGDPPEPAVPGFIYFPETGPNVPPRFFQYWQANGGLAQFGYPISAAFTEQLEDGRRYTVQYFERARFEHHPEHAPPYDILLGQFGRQILAERGGGR